MTSGVPPPAGTRTSPAVLSAATMKSSSPQLPPSSSSAAAIECWRAPVDACPPQLPGGEEAHVPPIPGEERPAGALGSRQFDGLRALDLVEDPRHEPWNLLSERQKHQAMAIR